MGNTQPWAFPSLTSSLGMLHTHTRLDRGEHVHVNYLNVLPDKWIDYSWNPLQFPLGTEYDCDSIMHYRDTSFNIGNSITLEVNEHPNQDQYNLFRRSIRPVADFARDLTAPPAPTSIWSTSFTIADSLGWRQGSGKQRIIRETLLKWKTWLGGDLSQVGGEEVILIPMFTYRSADQASKSKKRLNRFRGGGGVSQVKRIPLNHI